MLYNALALIAMAWLGSILAAFAGDAISVQSRIRKWSLLAIASTGLFAWIALGYGFYLGPKEVLSRFGFKTYSMPSEVEGRLFTGFVVDTTPGAIPSLAMASAKKTVEFGSGGNFFFMDGNSTPIPFGMRGRKIIPKGAFHDPDRVFIEMELSKDFQKLKYYCSSAGLYSEGVLVLTE